MRDVIELMVCETTFGQLALARQNEQILALSFGHSSKSQATTALLLALGKELDHACAETNVVSVSPGEDALVDRLRAYADGEPDDFDDINVDAEHLTDFARKVTNICRHIPRGQTLTYGEVAKQAGSPGAARAVGSVMARNRVPLIVPCHRVVPSSGGLGGYSAAQGVAMKKQLLEMESQPSELFIK